jgi:hypothetical protein
MIVKIRKAVWQQDSQQVLFTVVMLLCVFGVAALIAMFGFGQPPGKSLYIALVSSALVIAFFLVFTWFKDRWQAGPVVVDLLPVPGRRSYFMMGGLVILLGFLGSYGSASLSASASQLISSLLGLSFGTYEILVGFSRLEIRKNGIIISADFMVEFVPWDKIEAFEWVKGDGEFSTLKVQYRTQFPAFLRKVDLPVPIEKKQQVELLLEQYVPGQALGEKRLHP